MISVVVVAGACGIAAGTPLAILGAIGQAARQGAIVKGGLYLESLSEVDTVVLDKTGTLTYGEPEVVAIHPAPGATAEEVLAAAAIAERPSEHALGKAVLRSAAAAALSVVEPEHFASVPGKGVVCTTGAEEIVVGSRAFLAERALAVTACGFAADQGSEVYVARQGRSLGDLHVADVLRPEAKTAVVGLRQMGLRTILLTGDTEAVAGAVGHELDIDEVEAGLLPAGKLARIEALLGERRKVAMIGDGVNDAPALMRASVGVAMGSGTDVARESAPVVLLGNDLRTFVETVRIARRCRRIVTANFVGTLLVDGIGVGLAAFGLLAPPLAAFVHVASELAFLLNSARLLPGRADVARTTA